MYESFFSSTLAQGPTCALWWSMRRERVPQVDEGNAASRPGFTVCVNKKGPPAANQGVFESGGSARDHQGVGNSPAGMRHQCKTQSVEQP